MVRGSTEIRRTRWQSAARELGGVGGSAGSYCGVGKAQSHGYKEKRDSLMIDKDARRDNTEHRDTERQG